MNDVKRINLDDYIQTGEGATALTYTSKDGKTLAKLYNLGFEADRAKEEFLTAQIVFEMGIPTPEPYRLVTDGERLGGEYELIKGKRSFARIISQEPERLEEISLEFARMTKELHADKCENDRFSLPPDTRDARCPMGHLPPSLFRHDRPTAHRGSQPSDSPVRCHQGAFYAYYR